jgi:tetratricopeptide (TPR) repeat protein
MWQKGYWYDYKKLAEIAFRSLARTNETPKRAQLAYELGWAYMEEREFKQARKLFKEAQALYTESNDFGGVFRILRDMGSLQLRLDRLGSALVLYREMERRLETEDKIDVQTRTMREAEISNLLGNAFTKLHDFTKSERYLDMAIRKYRSLGILAGITLRLPY